MTVRATLVPAAVALLLLAACSAATSAGPPSSIVAPPPAEPSVRVPRVVHPLDARGVEACSLLPPAVLSDVGMEPASAEDRSTELATSCGWTAVHGEGLMALTVNVNTSLDMIYGAIDQSRGSEVLSVQGFPAVREGPPDSSYCTYYVAVADPQVLAVEVGTWSADVSLRACDSAARATNAVIDALRSRS